MKISPTARRSAFRDSGDRLEWEIPSKKNVFLLIFGAAWLGGWAMGETFAIRQLSTADGPDAFLMFWLVGWTVGGAFATSAWSWMAFGKEVITVRSGELTVRRQVLGLGWSKEYDLEHIKHLRVSLVAPDAQSANVRPWGIGGGLVAFDYGAGTFRFGAGIDESEANMIVAEIRERHAYVGSTD